MRGTKRRRAMAILIFLQAILFGATTPIGNYSLIHFTTGNPTLSGVEGPGWRLSEGQLNFDQVFALAASIVVATLVWRGLPFAIYSTAALAAISVVFDVGFALQFLLLGWPAILFLFFFPLPTVPPAVIAIPVLLLALTLILDNRRATATAGSASTSAVPSQP
jgi:hypothetical protein